MGFKHPQVFPVFSRGKRERLPHPGTLQALRCGLMPLLLAIYMTNAMCMVH